jgi:hypothetical protein
LKALLPLPLCLLALPAAAQTDYSALLRDQGLSAARDTLSAIAAPTPSDRFALGGVLFLGAVERALQTRWQAGLSDGLAVMSDFPLLRLPIPENPSPAPFDPATVESLFRAMSDDLATAIDTLAPVADTDDVAVTISTADIWFDINMNATRDPGEGFSDVAGLALGGGLGPDMPALTIRFDTADAAWLSAYAHLLSAVSQTVLALSPTETITNVIAARDAMQTLSPGYRNPLGDYFLPDAEHIADLAAIFIGAIEQRPDPALTLSVRDHLLATVADNRTFWRRVALEQDNDAEWIPNKRQTSALPLAFPADTGSRWLAVLTDAEALLRGDLLIPHWRLAPDAGINLARILENPPELDIIGIIQGQTLVPYMEQGRRIDARNLMAFEQLVAGDAGLFMIILN